MAAIPVTEMLVLRLFSTLVVDGVNKYENLADAAGPVAVFLVALGLARGAHHVVRFARVRVFRNAFEAGQRQKTPSQESWEWAMAFELSGVLISLVQALAFGVLFLMLDWVTGATNAVATVAVLIFVSYLFRHQLDAQRGYVATGTRPGSVPIATRLGDRIRAAELGSVVASMAMVLVLTVMLLRTIVGAVSTADAIVMFLALRLVAGQLGSLSAAVMRFARASARRGEP
ncbi:hypothetical protein [Ruania alba]|nr:hypothetical protein [Ruania alba]